MGESFENKKYESTSLESTNSVDLIVFSLLMPTNEELNGNCVDRRFKFSSIIYKSNKLNTSSSSITHLRDQCSINVSMLKLFSHLITVIDSIKYKSYCSTKHFLKDLLAYGYSIRNKI